MSTTTRRRSRKVVHRSPEEQAEDEQQRVYFVEKFLRLTAELDWTFAKTYAATAPHEYVVRDKGCPWQTFDLLAVTIKRYAVPEKWHGRTFYYWTPEGSQYKYWAMEGEVINRDFVGG